MQHRLAALATLILATFAQAQVTCQGTVTQGRVVLQVEAPSAELVYGLLAPSPATVPTPLGAALAAPAVVPFAPLGNGSFVFAFEAAQLRAVGGTCYWQAAVLAPNQPIALQPLASLTLPPPQRARIVVLAGQSNMEGAAALPLPPGIRDRNTFLPVWDRLTDPAAPRWAALVAGGNNNGAFRFLAGGARREQGPEMAFAESFARHVEAGAQHAPTVLVKAAQGGSALFPLPQSPDYTWDPGTGGNLYDDLGGAALPGRGCLLQDLRDAIASLGGPDAVERIDFCWYQGESDALAEISAAQYEERLMRFLRRVRADLAALPVTFHLVQLHRDLVRGAAPGEGFFFRDVVRAAQAAVAAQEPGVRLLKVDDLRLAPDQTHYDAFGYQAVGERLFASWLASQE